MSSINVRDIYLTGMQVEETEAELKEQEKVGNLRAGNSAIMTADGEILGKCARKTWLRKLGIKSDTHTLDRLLMFSAGFASEEIWHDRLSKGWSGTILREEEIPVEWTTSNGTKVTGRPDMVLCVDEEGLKPTPKLVLEMKNVSSLWTARSVLFEEQPKFDHMCQAAHYSWQLGVPAKLCYSLYLDLAVMGWAQRHFPKPGDKYAEHCEFNEKGDIKKVKPFIQIYDLEIRDGKLNYSVEGSGHWIETPITRDGIQRYYEAVSQLSEDDKELPPRPLTVKGDGSKENWSQCGYCPLAETCDRYEEDASKWIDAVKGLRWED